MTVGDEDEAYVMPNNHSRGHYARLGSISFRMCSRLAAIPASYFHNLLAMAHEECTSAIKKIDSWLLLETVGAICNHGFL